MSDGRTDDDADEPREVVLRLPIGPEPSLERDGPALRRAAARELGLDEDHLGELRIRRSSFDARRRHRDWRLVLDAWRADERPTPPPATRPTPIDPPPAPMARPCST